MSAYVDAQRREQALAARVEASKATRRKLDDVVRLELEGLSEREMARRLGVDRRIVAQWRYVLGLSTRIPAWAFTAAIRSAAKRGAGRYADGREASDV